MKKAISLILVLAMCLPLCACGGGHKEVMERIEALNGTVTLDSGPFIEEAEAAYANLSDSQKSKVTNYAVLVSARSQFDELYKNVKNVITSIDEIPEVDAIVFDDGWPIAGAWIAYNNLTDQEKAKVNNLDKLNAAIEKVNTLPGEMNESYINYSVSVEDYYGSSKKTECRFALTVESVFPFLRYEDVSVTVKFASVMTVLGTVDGNGLISATLDADGNAYALSALFSLRSSFYESEIVSGSAITGFTIKSGTVYFNIDTIDLSEE